ncbi:MAG: hypothetical protein H0U72_03600 [Nitrosospira sp.]|nr:hypothetical protein [Nitrosospira sp.]
MKIERKKGLERMLDQARLLEKKLGGIDEKLGRWGKLDESQPASRVIESLIASGFKAPRAKATAKEEETCVGCKVQLKDSAKAHILAAYGKEDNAAFAENLLVVAVMRMGDKPNSPREFVVSNDEGDRFPVRPSQLEG